MANKLKELKAKRELCIDQITTIHTLAESASIIDHSIFAKFKACYKDIDKAFKNFESSHSEIMTILCATENPDFGPEKVIRNEVLDMYYAIKGRYSELDDEYQAQSLPATPQRGNNAPQQQHSHDSISLPSISVPVFEGDYKDWSTFKDLYDSVYHYNSNISDVRKFTHLQTLLRGEPLALVKNLPKTDDNYKIAYHALLKRYENKRLLSNTYWSNIVNAHKLTSDSGQGLRKLLNIFVENLEALRVMGLPVDEWDFPLFNILFQKLDISIVKRFELQAPSNDIPSYRLLTSFLERQCTALESVALATCSNRNPISTASSNSNRFQKGNHNYARNQTKQSTALVANTHAPNNNSANNDSHKPQFSTFPCILCHSNQHLIYKCPTFLSKSSTERNQLVRQNHWCVNCLHSRHQINSCNSRMLCQTCRGRHHTLLHNTTANDSTNYSSDVNVSTSQSSNFTPSDQPSARSNYTTLHTASQSANISRTTILPTALVDIRDTAGNYHSVRVLIDSCSQINAISQKCANRLGLKRSHSSLNIFGLGGCSSQALGSVECTIKPQSKLEPIFSFEAVVMPQISSEMPSSFISAQNWHVFSGLHLADVNFNRPGPVDLLLGATLFPNILDTGIVRGSANEPSAINTIFGWIIMGSTSSQTSNFSFLTTHEPSIHETIRKFWEIEEPPTTSVTSPDDVQCEEIFKSTVSRDSSGRYIVTLPFKNSCKPIFPDSRLIASKQFLSLERRLLRDPELYSSYCDFLKDYLEAGHMELIPDFSQNLHHSCYIPHHGILKPESTTTKLRVVFNASSKCSSNYSLNDTLLTGAKLQKDLPTLLHHFRLHKYVFSADIKQMYRQIIVHPSQTDYQRILWRFSPSQDIQDYRLLRVTYGVSSAPFLALRTLAQLACDEKELFPKASTVILNDVYIDDIVTGESDLHNALKLRNEIISLLEKGGFHLRKWASNHPDLLKAIPKDHLLSQSLTFDSDASQTIIKILGLKWNPSSDVFSYSVHAVNRSCTKRAILSEIARIFDPLGYLAPLTFWAKHLIQYLWTQGLGWDDSPGIDVLHKWTQYKTELPLLSNVQIPRRLMPDEFDTCELHGFSDSSEKGYAAVIYFRFLHQEHITISLVCAKSKVAPLKRISIPRLELCGALLLSELISSTLTIFSTKLSFSKIVAWTDSTIVLHWIKSSPHEWKSFVSNRVTKIQENVEPSSWRHIRSEFNPADCASRGLLPSELLNQSLWWSAPAWLHFSESEWPSSLLEDIDNSEAISEEMRPVGSFSTTTSFNNFDFLPNKFSSLSKIKRIIAFCYRAVHNFKNPETRIPISEPFTSSNLHTALLILVKQVQQVSFSTDIDNIQRKLPLSKPLRRLNPFLDEIGVLRVGGRLTHSGLTYDQKFPALLPQRHRLTDLIILDIHANNFHPGLQTLHFLILQQFWILSARRVIRRCLSQCFRCFRTNPKPLQPPMGNLPSFRVNQVKPFSIVGVDYGGPFSITMSKTRGSKSLKAYMCLFICSVTKAIHLELASDISSEAFLACLRRFIARRGRCSQLFSDQGTNFVGAANYLNSLMKSSASAEHIQWSFNPPAAPHFGGLFEAGIKSAKTHLLRIIGQQVLCYEEFYTVLCQVESLLNSRPLCPLSNDPSDLSVLTPGHFLTLEPLTSIPEPNVQHLPLNRLSRWQLLQRVHQDFWTRWHTEYLHTLQQRNKWVKDSPALSVGDMVLIKNEQTAPLNWKLARVTDVHSGKDGIIRVATLRTASGLMQRPLVKLCPLPSLEANNSD